MQKDYLTPAEVAEWLMVSPITVRQWADKGWLAALTTPGGHRRFARDAVEIFARERRLRFNRPASAARILVVDDDTQLAGYLHELLHTSLENCAVEIARNGFEAGQKVQTFRPGLILLDLMMPGMDGFEVCVHLRTTPATQNIRIIAMTGFATAEYTSRIIAAGAESCFTKPLDAPALLAAIEARPLTKNPGDHP